MHCTSSTAPPVAAVNEAFRAGRCLGLAAATGLMWIGLSPLTMMVAGRVAGFANGWLSPAFVEILLPG